MAPAPRKGGSKKPKKVLRDRTNNANTSNTKKIISKKKDDSKKKLTEADWRDNIFKFYESPIELKVSVFCKDNALSLDSFNRRWKGSKLNESNPKNKKKSITPPSVSVAMVQYDTWLKNWKEGHRQQRSFARKKEKSAPFIIHIDKEEDNVGTRLSHSTPVDTTDTIITGSDGGAGNNNDQDNILCASNAVGKCKMPNPIVLHPKAHVCFYCKKPMHALCGCGDKPDELLFCAVCNDEKSTNNANDLEGNNNNNHDSSNSIGGGDDSSNDNSIIITDVPEKIRTKKLSPKEMRDALIAFFLTEKETKLGTFIRENGLESNETAIRNHWNFSGLLELKPESKSVTYAFNKYDEWRKNEDEARATKNKRNGSQNQAIPEHIRLFIRELIKQLAACGQGLARKVVEKIVNAALDDHEISRRTLDRYMEQYDLRCKGVKNIDPKRIAQVTTEKRDLFFHNLDAIVKHCHNIDETNCPWEDWAAVDADCKSNLDEMSSDPTSSLRDKIIIPKELHGRIFQQTPQGDKNDRHVTLVVFSTSDGKYEDQDAKIDGAPPPIIIHSKGKAKKGKDTSTTPAEKRMDLYDNDPSPVDVDSRFHEGLGDSEHLGIKVLTSVNGSMTKELMPEVADHIIKHLRPDQGINGKYTFLLMDSHVSRWHPKALYLLFKYRVIPLFFPSHLTIVVQPQDNGVILYLHKCLEDASLIPRLFASGGESDISFCNRVIAEGYTNFREGERRKLLTRGRNSTTRAYRDTGIEPRNPQSEGWNEALSLFAGYNGMKITNKEDFICYCVTPNDKIACPPFTDADIDLLNTAVPVLASGENSDTSILSDPKSKCWTIAKGIIASYMDMSQDDRPPKPIATTETEKLALRHMTIGPLITAVAKSEGAMILDKYYDDKKREAMLTSIKQREIIKVQLKNSAEKEEWWNAIRMNQDNSWSVCDGDKNTIYSTTELEEQYIIDTSYFMFPDDKRLIANGYQSDRRRKKEKQSMITTLAQSYGEEQRDKELEAAFYKFMALPAIEQTFIKFKQTLVTQIEQPSDHKVKFKYEEEDHELWVCAHGGNGKTTSVSQLVASNICRIIIGHTSQKQNEKSKKKKGGSMVTRVQWGSCGFEKSHQMDEEYKNDTDSQRSKGERKKRAAIELCRTRLKSITKLQNWAKFDSIWNDIDSTIILTEVSGKCLQYLLKIFNVKGRGKCTSKTPAIIALSEVYITRGGIDHLKVKLVAEFSDLGEVYDPTDDILDSSILDASFSKDDSLVNTSTVIDDTDVDASVPLFDDDDEGSNLEEDQYEGESETSAGEESSYDGNEDNNNDDINNNSRRTSVSFHPNPSVRIIPSRLKKTENEVDREKYSSWIGRRIIRDLSVDDDVDDNTCMEGSIKEAWMYKGSWYFEIVYEGVLDSNGNPDTEDISLSVFADTCTFYDDADNSTSNDNGNNNNNEATMSNSNGHGNNETMTTAATITTTLSPATTHHDDNNDDNDNDRSFISDSLLKIVTETDQKLINVLEESSGTPIAENRDDDDYSAGTADDAGLEELQAMTADDTDLEVLQTIVHNQQPTDSLDNPPGISTAVSNEDNDDDSDDSDDDDKIYPSPGRAPPKIKLNVGDEIEFFREGATHGNQSSLKSSVVGGIRPDETFILNLTSGNFLYPDHLIRILPDGHFRSIDTFTLEQSGEQEWIGGQMRDTTERFKKVHAAIKNKTNIYWSNGAAGEERGDDVRNKENETPTIIHDQIDHRAANTIDQRTLRRSNRRPPKK